MIRSKIALLRRSIIPANDCLPTDGLHHYLRLIDSNVVTVLIQAGFGFDYPHCDAIGYLLSLCSPLHASSPPQLSATEQKTCSAIKQEVRLLCLNSFFCC